MLILRVCWLWKHLTAGEKKAIGQRLEELFSVTSETVRKALGLVGKA